MQQQLFQPDERERENEIDRRILDVLCGRVGTFPPTDEQRKLLHILQYAKGASKAVPIRTLADKTGISERGIKDAVRSLIMDFGIRVAGSRTAPYGYYLIMTSAEAEDAVRPLQHEIVSLARRVRVLKDKHYLLALLGQITAEIQGEKGEAA